MNITLRAKHFIQTVVSTAAILSACSDGPSAVVDTGKPGLRVVAGSGVTDTIEARLPQALVVEVRNSLGRILPGSIVTFESRPADDTTRKDRASYACKLTTPYCGPPNPDVVSHIAVFDTTDANGRARVSVRLGQVAGRVVIRISVDQLSLVDSAVYAVMPGAATAVRAATTDTIINIGATATLRGRVVDRFRNSRPETVAHTLGMGNALTLDATTSVVTGQAFGMQWLYARFNTFLDSTRVSVTPIARLVARRASGGEVRLVSANGTSMRSLTAGNTGGLFPQFDPTRQHVTFYIANSGTVIDTSGSPRRDIGPGTGFVTVISMRLLADGNAMFVANRTGTPGFVVWRVAPDNAVTFVAAPPGIAQITGSADFSPDGSKIVYDALTDLPPGLRVYDFASATFKDIEIGGRSPRWSPQGDRVAFLPASNVGVGIINANGTGRRVVGTAVLNVGLNWSPDGAYIIGRSQFTTNTGVLRVVRTSDGTDVVLRLKNATGGLEDYIEPDWRSL